MAIRLRAGKAMVVTLGVCALLGIVAGTGFGFLIGKRSDASAAETAKSSPTRAAGKSTAPATVYSLGEMVVNLADVGSLRYAKLSVALGFEETLGEEKLKTLAPVLRDAVIDILTRKRFGDLHQKNGIPKLKKEILAAARARVPDATIVGVYLEAFAMQ